MEHTVDYKKGILHGCLQRQAPSIDNVDPILVDYWVCEINPKDSPKLLALLKSHFHHTSESLKHLKRMYKVKSEEGIDKLRVILCPVVDAQEYHLDEHELQNMISEIPLNKFDLVRHQIPRNKPFDKDVNQMWSKIYWPLLWKGNPLIQELNEINRNLNVDKIKKYMEMIVKESSNGVDGNTSPIVTIFVDPKTDTIKSIKRDERTKFDPINHTVMNCISEIAQDEVNRRNEVKDDKNTNNYLCLNYHVYTTHEPCTMCSMALVHSRISQLVYLKHSSRTGGIGQQSGHKEMIHISCSLNWKFEAFQYLDPELDEEVDSVDPEMYV